MPQNELAEVYTELLARQRLEPASFHHKVKEMVMPGAYRRLVQRPRDLSWQYFRYTDPRVPLARTDLARLRGDPEPQGVADGPRLARSPRHRAHGGVASGRPQGHSRRERRPVSQGEGRGRRLRVC